MNLPHNEFHDLDNVAIIYNLKFIEGQFKMAFVESMMYLPSEWTTHIFCGLVKIYYDKFSYTAQQFNKYLGQKIVENVKCQSKLYFCSLIIFVFQELVTNDLILCWKYKTGTLTKEIEIDEDQKKEMIGSSGNRDIQNAYKWGQMNYQPIYLVNWIVKIFENILNTSKVHVGCFKRPN